MAIIECRKLKKVYRVGDNEIIPLHEIDLDIEKGETVAILSQELTRWNPDQ